MQTSSWHGTTIQAVQPKPSLALNASHTKRGKPSPYPSPSKSCRSPAPKTQRRESEHSSEHTDNGHTSDSPTQQVPTGGIDSRKKLKLEQFKMTSWHLLKNFQIALMKPYFEAGLKELARVSGYPVASIQTCGQFKRTHCFILEVWEALYLCMVEKYMAHTDDIEIDQLELLDILNSAFLKATINDPENAKTTTERISQSLKQLRCYDSFREFLEHQSAKSSTWKFWAQFVFEDAFAYIGLFLSIRSGNWELRNGSIKMMASLYSAYDHQTYKKLIANHLADILTLPTSILTSLQNGSFVVSCTGRSWHSVGIDECHEMCINKDCKCCIVRPSKDFINRIANYIPYRAKSLKNLLKQISLKLASEKQVEIPKDNLSSKPSVLKECK